MSSPEAFEQLDLRAARPACGHDLRPGGPRRRLFVGGVGLRRGRRDPETPAVGSVLDFWRVEAHEPARLLRLRAEMRLPGRAWLQWEVEAQKRGSRIRQTAIFDPAGFAGLLYWYALLPLHRLVFDRMLDGIARQPGLVDSSVQEQRQTQHENRSHR